MISPDVAFLVHQEQIKDRQRKAQHQILLTSSQFESSKFHRIWGWLMRQVSKQETAKRHLKTVVTR